MTTCKSCGAPVVWVLTTKGGRMPLDAEPVADGNVVIEASVARTLRKAEREQESLLPRYRSHFSTCPDAAKFRTDGDVPGDPWKLTAVEAWIDAARWTHAKSVPRQHHEYHVRRDSSGDGYWEVVRQIRSNGVKRRWHDGKAYLYWENRGYEYWEARFMLNRRHLSWEDAPLDG